MLLASIMVAVTLPFSVKLNGASIILLSLVWLLEGQWKLKFERLRHSKVAILFILFYFVHVAGLIYTENIEQGFDELEKRVAFVIFPVIFSTTSYLDRIAIQRILTSFVVACLIAALICVGYGLYFYFQGNPEYLFYHKLGTAINFTHAIYFSFYIGFALFILLTGLRASWTNLSPFRKSAGVSVVCFFIVFLILLSSKTLIPTVLLLVVIFLGSILVKRIGRWKSVAVLIPLLAVAATLVIKIPNIRDRFKDVFVDKYEQPNPLFLDDYLYYHFTAGAIRLAIWKMSVGAIDDRGAWLHGVGTGDSQDVLTETYIQKHVYPGDQQLGVKGFLHYNAHNQFMQFLVMFGLLGLSLFIYVMLVLLRIAFKHSTLFLFFLILFTAFSLTESTLHVQKGIVPFMFFSSLFAARNFHATEEGRKWYPFFKSTGEIR